MGSFGKRAAKERCINPDETRVRDAGCERGRSQPYSTGLIVPVKEIPGWMRDERIRDIFFFFNISLFRRLQRACNEIVSRRRLCIMYLFVLTLRTRRSSKCNNKFTDPNLTETSAVLIRRFDGEKRN